MECFSKRISGYQFIFIYNKNLIKVYIRDNLNKDRKFSPIKIKYEDNAKNFISNFEDLFDLINKNIIKIKIKEHLSPISQPNSNEAMNIKYIELNFINEDIFTKKAITILSCKIYMLNVEYYVTKGVLHQRINSKPFLSYLTKDFFNKEDIFDLINREKILTEYILDDIKYFNNEKNLFQIITNENIKFGEKLILEFHILEKKCNLSMNLKLAKEYFENEIIKIKNKINKLTDSSKKYDLIYLYASPIINISSKGDLLDCESPISYMNEIRIILELMKNNRKQFNCKFECIDEKVLEDVIINNKTKILHISSHGAFNGKNYSLIIENLRKYGERKAIDYNKLEMILKSGDINIKKIDLVILTTCYSEDFGKLFLKYGAKNVIYLNRETEVLVRISVLFVKYFYQNMLEGKSIEESYIKTLELMELNKEIIKYNDESCCCNHYHLDKCELRDSDNRKYIHKNIHLKKIEICKCNYKMSNYHKDDCEYAKLFENDIINKGTNKEINPKQKIRKDNNLKIMCCCNNSIQHNEILKIIYETRDYNSYIKLFKLNGNGELNINSTIKFYYDNEKFSFTLGRRDIIGKIFNKIMNNENYVILYGEKDLLKTDFAESLCVYLYERKIISDYEIFKINNEFDFEYMKEQLRENNNKNNIKKNVKIIKFNFDIESEDYKKSFDYLYNIYDEFCCMNNNDYYFIFIFDTEDNNINNIKDNINKNMIKTDNIFYLGINVDFSFGLLSNLIKGKNIAVPEGEAKIYLEKVVKNRQKKIKLISELLINGETFENIQKMGNLEITYIKLNRDNPSFPLYYLLYNMPFII